MGSILFIHSINHNYVYIYICVCVGVVFSSILVSVLDPYGLSVCVISPVICGVYIYIYTYRCSYAVFKWTEDGKIE